MSFCTWKVVRNAFVDNNWSVTNEDVTTFFDPVVTVNTGDARDTFSFKVTNTRGTLSNYFKPNDKITISRVLNSSSVASSDLLMVGSVQNVPENKGYREDVIRVEGSNFSETILSGIVFFDARGLTIPDAIKRALDSIGVYNSNFKVVWKSSNPVVNSVGGSFPLVQEKWFNKPIKSFIEKYSSSASTGDGNYYWYVNSSNEFVWERKDDVADYVFNSAITPFRSFRINKDLKEVKNWVIVKGGIDPKGAAIQTRVQDMSSIARHGIKPYILVTISKNAETLLKEDLNAQGVSSATSLSFPYTPSWLGSSVSSFDDYTEAMRSYVVAQAKLEGEAFLAGTKNGKLLLDIVFYPGRIRWGLGDVIECSVPSLGAGSKNLRVKEISYSEDADTFTLEEDVGSI